MRIDSSTQNYLMHLVNMRIVQDRQSADRVWQEQQHQQIQYEKTMHYSSDSIRGTNVDVTV